MILLNRGKAIKINDFKLLFLNTYFFLNRLAINTKKYYLNKTNKNIYYDNI